jgi:hypothetical protein
MHIVAAIVAIGKGAIGGAGFMLAMLGAFNAFFSAVAHGWIHSLSYSGTESAMATTVSLLGALLGGVLTAKFGKKSVS